MPPTRDSGVGLLAATHAEAALGGTGLTRHGHRPGRHASGRQALTHLTDLPVRGPAGAPPPRPPFSRGTASQPRSMSVAPGQFFWCSRVTWLMPPASSRRCRARFSVKRSTSISCSAIYIRHIVAVFDGCGSTDDNPPLSAMPRVRSQALPGRRFGAWALAYSFYA